MTLRSLTKAWPEKLLYAVAAIIATFVWTINTRLARIESKLDADKRQDAQLQWLVERSVLEYDRLNDTRQRMRPPLWAFPYEDKK